MCSLREGATESVGLDLIFDQCVHLCSAFACDTAGQGLFCVRRRACSSTSAGVLAWSLTSEFERSLQRCGLAGGACRARHAGCHALPSEAMQ